MEKWNREIRLQECVFDATTVVYGGGALIKKDWWPEDEDSRNIFQEIREIAEFYEDHYPEDDEDYLENIEYLTIAWFKRLFNGPISDLEDTFLLPNYRVAEAVRSLDCRYHDYACWLTIEGIIGREIKTDEYERFVRSKIARQIENLDEPKLVSEQDKEKIREFFKPLKEYVIRRVLWKHVDFSVVVKAHSEEEAKAIYEKNEANDEYTEQWLDANDYAEIDDETMSIEEIEEG